MAVMVGTSLEYNGIVVSSRVAMCWALIVWRQSVKCEQVAMQPYVNVISIIQTSAAEALTVLSTRLTTVDSPPSPCQMDLTYIHS